LVVGGRATGYQAVGEIPENRLRGRGMQQRLVMLAVILHVALASSAYAHHSHFYDQCRSITIEGRVEQLEFKNPRNSITLRLDDGTAYIVDWNSRTQLTNAGAYTLNCDGK
jgi:hypothetical protein